MFRNQICLDSSFVIPCVVRPKPKLLNRYRLVRWKQSELDIKKELMFKKKNVYKQLNKISETQGVFVEWMTLRHIQNEYIDVVQRVNVR